MESLSLNLAIPGFGGTLKEVVPLLLAELKQPLSDDHLEWAVKSLDTYPSTEVVEAVKPLLEHQNQQVRRRARLTLDALEREEAGIPVSQPS